MLLVVSYTWICLTNILTWLGAANDTKLHGQKESKEMVPLDGVIYLDDSDHQVCYGGMIP
jgi:hypothetical protein